MKVKGKKKVALAQGTLSLGVVKSSGQGLGLNN